MGADENRQEWAEEIPLCKDDFRTNWIRFVIRLDDVARTCHEFWFGESLKNR